ncbi:MAG: class I SAM-dependent methyltransferase [Candidatus Limnocylindria bacterium]
MPDPAPDALTWSARVRPSGRGELRALGGPRRFRGKRVLELGAGSGRLTVVYGPLAREVVAVDTDPEAVAAGRERAAALGLAHVRFAVAPAERPGVGRERFDVALFTWSL